MAFMTHPGLPKADPATVTEDAFHEVWEKKGWQLVQPGTPTQSSTPAPAASRLPASSTPTEG